MKINFMYFIIANTVSCWSQMKELNNYNNKYFSTFQNKDLAGNVKLFLNGIIYFNNKY